MKSCGRAFVQNYRNTHSIYQDIFHAAKLFVHMQTHSHRGKLHERHLSNDGLANLYLCSFIYVHFILCLNTESVQI